VTQYKDPQTAAKAPRTTAPQWLRIPAVIAPVALIGGWTLAAVVQPGHYSSVYSTISDLAATNAHLRGIMTTGFVLTGLCLLLIAAAFEPCRTAGRIAIGLGGVGVLVVAAEPLPQNAYLHGLGAFLAFVSLAVWPVLGWRGTAPSARAAKAATSCFVVLLIWVEFAPGYALGVGERLLAGGEILWVSALVFASSGSRQR
jgi:hypothetical membrane protein